MNEAEAIIGIYRGFQTAIGCGDTYLRLDGERWILSWVSPFPKQGESSCAARYGFDPVRLAINGIPGGHTPEAWGAILASEVREKWGGNPDRPVPGAKPLVCVDGLGE